MRVSKDTLYQKRCSFQQTLDDAFPKGAMCAVLETVDGHLVGTHRLMGSTGRLFCCGARKRSSTGMWEYEVLIDRRKSEKTEEEPIRVWITDIMPNSAVDGLWDADVVDESGDRRRLLRLNAEPPAPVRPSKRMRSAVTKAYETELFPRGMTVGADTR
jgi:hypothetical protein